MKFCQDCNSLLYTKHIGDEEKKLSYYCKLCNKETGNTLEESDHVIYQSEYLKDNLTKTNAMLKYAKYDLTLPRLNIDCQNSVCMESKKGQVKSYDDCIIYIRYNNADLSNIYLCPLCNHTWKNKSN